MAVAFFAMTFVPAGFGQPQEPPIRVPTATSMVRFVDAVNRRFVADTRRPAPMVEPGATTDLVAEFCAGLGPPHPAIIVAARQIRPEEFEACVDAGARRLIEMNIGHEGIAVVVRRGTWPMGITARALFLAIARRVPADGKLVPNTYTRWSQISPDLPDTPILVLLPSTRNGARSVFDSLVLQAGCRGLPEVDQIFAAAERVRLCTELREGDYVREIDLNSQVVAALVDAQMTALGVVSNDQLMSTAGGLDVIALDGVLPTPAAIRSGAYPASVSMLVYVKHDLLEKVPGLTDYLAEFVRERTSGDSGYLAELGLVALDPAQRRQVRRDVLNHRRFRP